VVTMVLVGGMGSIWGSLFGALLMTILPEALQGVKEYNVLVYGLVLMGVLVFFPHGLMAGIAGALKKEPNRRDSGAEDLSAWMMGPEAPNSKQQISNKGQ